MQLQVKIVARQLGYNFILVSLVFLGVAGCSTPIGVKRVGTKEAHHLLTANVLSAGTPSLHSLQVLSRLDLREQFDDDPQAALAALHTILQSTPDSYRLNNRLFALAELSFFYAEQQRQRPAQDYQCMALKGRPCSSDRRPREETQAYYLAATVYAYALLFPEDPQSVPLDPADPRLRLASWLVTLPGDLSQRTLTTFTQNQDKLLIQ